MTKDNTKHTPGPWVINRHGYESYYTAHSFIESEADGCVCGQWWPDGNAESEANAHLIAAAPRMYERISSLAAEGDAEAISIMEEIHGRR